MTEEPTESILVVEDDPGVANLEKRRLERAGYAVVTAATAEEALRTVQQTDVALILLDYMLPDVNGIEFFRRLKAVGREIPVIMVTARNNEVTIIEALRVGVRDFVTKSREYLDYLPEAVERVLRHVRIEERLAESEARLAGIIASAKDAIIVVAANERITLFNAAAEQMFRCTAAKAIGQAIHQFIPRESAAGPATHRNGTTATPDPGSSRLQFGDVGVRADGEEFPVEASVSAATVGGRRFHTIIIRDITERKKAEEALRESEQRFRMFMDNSPAVAFVKDQNGRYTYVSNNVERFLGLKAADQLGRTDEELWPPDVARKLRANDLIVLSSGKTMELEETLPLPDGSDSYWLAFKFSLQDGSGRRYLGGVGIEVTKHRQLVEQFRQAQKMEAVGKLAGGVAHDFNNLLTIIMGYSDLCLGSLGKDVAVRGMIEEIKKGAERAAELTRQLLAFSRKQVLAPKVLDLNVVVGETEKMIRRLIGEDIRLTFVPAPDLRLVKADPGQIEQALTNLLVNARDAMPRGGKVTIETANVDLDEAYAQSRSEVQPGPYAMLAVSDTGCGMDEATKARIFEPFFTTKEPGKGTGLGLATVYGMVKQSAGHIAVYSELGHGTTMKIYLPQAADPKSASPPLASVAEMSRGGDEMILLVEDEKDVRCLARLTLEAKGYQVLEAANGEEALRLCQQHQGSIHLLVTDVVMPGIGGRQLGEYLAPLQPTMKVLFVSGYTDDAIVHHGILNEGTPFLQKPFTPLGLARKVQEVLDQ